MTQKIGEQIEFVSIADPKFKTNAVEVQFLMYSSHEKNAARMLAASLLAQSCEKYPTMSAMTRKLNSLYGAFLSASGQKRGDVMHYSICANSIDSRYALAGEDLNGELVALLTECLFSPNARDGSFSETEFRIQQQDQLDAIEAEINSKRFYAMSRAYITAFDGEPVSAPLYGTAEQVEALSAQEAFAAYQELMKTAVIRVYHAGPAHLPELGEALKNAFSSVERAPETICFESISPVHTEVQNVTEPMDVNQSKLVMVFKGEEKKKGAARLFSTVFGAAPFSMLFANVREKMSLCYYCASRTISGKNAMVVDSGVEIANVEKAHAAILEQLEKIKTGDFSDELITDAKHLIVNSLRSVGDTTSSCINWCHAQFCDGDTETVEEAVARYEALTRQDVIDMANAWQEDTVYLMQQEVQQHE